MWKTRDKDFILLREQQVKDVANLNTHMHIHMCIHTHTRFPDGAMVKNPPACTHTHTHTVNPPASAGDTGLIPGSGRSPGEGNGVLLQVFL